MRKKKLAPLRKQLTIRISEKEYETVLEYCAQNDISENHYVRALIRMHLGFEDDLKFLHTTHPRLRRKQEKTDQFPE